MTKKTLIIFFILIAFTSLAKSQEKISNLEQGMKLFYQKNWDEAISAFKMAQKDNPYDTLAISYLLDCYVKKGELNKISNEFEAQGENKGEDPLGLTYLGMAYFARSLTDSSMHGEAMEKFKQALKNDSKLPMAYTGMGLLYFQKRMIPRAKSYFLKALQLNPNDLLANELLGNILLVDEKQPEEALNYFQKIIEISPNYPDAYYYIGSSYYDLEKYPEAITALNKIMELDPFGITQGYYAPVLLGDIYLKEKKYPEAISSYEKALKINPQNSYAKYKLEKAKKPPKEK